MTLVAQPPDYRGEDLFLENQQWWHECKRKNGCTSWQVELQEQTRRQDNDQSLKRHTNCAHSLHDRVDAGPIAVGPILPQQNRGKQPNEGAEAQCPMEGIYG